MNPAAVYQDYSIQTQNRGKIVVMLYDGAIKFLKLAIKELEAGNYMEKGTYIGRAQGIINELNSALNMEVGGEIADNLRSLYNFMTLHLYEANMKADSQRVQEVIDLMEELNEGWKAVAE